MKIHEIILEAPASVNSDAYRSGWDEIFGSGKTSKPEVKPAAEPVRAPAAEPAKLSKISKAGKALGPVAMAYGLYQGWQEFKAIPKNITRKQYASEVTKIVTRLVADYGVWAVGSAIGGILTGAISGPGALVGAIVGGFASSYIIGDDVSSIVNVIVNKMYGTEDLPQTTNQSTPNQVTAQTGPNANPAPYTPGPTQLASDPSLAPQTSTSRTSNSQTPNNTGGAKSSWSEIYNLNKDVIGANPNLIKPGQVLKIPGKANYEVKPGDTLSKIAAKA